MENDLPNVHSKEVTVVIYQFIAKTKRVALGDHKVTPCTDAERQHVTADTSNLYTEDKISLQAKSQVSASITVNESCITHLKSIWAGFSSTLGPSLCEL